MEIKVRIAKGNGIGISCPINAAIEFCARNARNHRIGELHIFNMCGQSIGKGLCEDLIHPLQTLQKGQY